MLVLPAAAHPLVIDFESGLPNGRFGRIPDGYQGFNWTFAASTDAAQVIDFIRPTKDQIPAELVGLLNGVGCSLDGPVCTGTGAFNPNPTGKVPDNPTSISRTGAPFVLVSADWTSSFRDQTVKFEGLLGAQQRFERTILLTSTRQKIIFNWFDVDQLRITQIGTSDSWVLDNLTVSSVPEPGTLAFLFAGFLLGVISLRRR